MKGKWTTLTVAVAAVLLTVISSFAAGNVLFEDKFATLDPAWAAPSEWINVKDGKLIINGEKNLADNYLNQGAILPNDMDASVNMTFIKAADINYGSGLLFWAKDYNGWYCALINADGWFAVQRRVGDRFLMPVNWIKSDAIKKGAGVENQFRVVTKGSQATVYINGKQVISFSGQAPEGGSLIGFRVGSGPKESNSVAFSDLKVVAP